MKYKKILKRTKNNFYSMRLNDEHTRLIKASAIYNECSGAKVIEDALNRYFNLDRTITK